MYKKIMVPVDLAHTEKLAKALAVSADLAKHYNAAITTVAVTGSTPSTVAHNPKEFAEALEAFAAEQGRQHGVDFASRTMISPDPTIDLDDALARAASELDCDLIVMGSHVPGFAEHVFASRAGYLASHSELSVFVVR